MVKIKKEICKLVLLFLFTASSLAAEFTAEVDRSELNADEHLTLTLSLNNSDTRLRAQGVSPNIDLSVLTSDFDLGTPEVKNRYNIYRNRGRSTSSLSISLFPKETGNFTIPAFHLDGLTTATLPIKVQAPSDAPLAFTQATVNQQKIWVGQQLVIHLDLFTRIPLESAKLGGALETEPTPLELIEHIRLPRTERTEK
ncbi:MAG: protein BatD, partial [Gammaproteobacteria bacterium]|nr:protein BatD [Gammaproteobacteria bacterium]